jgi:hypothetical protein
MGFAIPSLPSGLLALIDTSPSVFYPPTTATKRARQRSHSFSDPETPAGPRHSSSPRPTHRRSHSAVPFSQCAYPSGFTTTSPLGALSEFDPLREAAHYSSARDQEHSTRASGSECGYEESGSSVSGSSPDKVPILRFSHLSLTHCSSSSVPPPQRTNQQLALPASGSSDPRPLRPPTSPRAMSAQDVRPSRPFARPRAGSVASSSSSVSDLNVLATWSFPSAVESGQRGRPLQKQIGSDALRQRLRTLSALDTASLPASSSFPTHCAQSSNRSRVSPSLPTNVRTRSFHRHTHSSPTPMKPSDRSMPPPPLPVNSPQRGGAPMLPPPPRPTRRPTTSRLRQPCQLAMPLERPSLSTGASPHSISLALSSSPHSMMSDTSSLPSPSMSYISLAGLPEPRLAKDREPWWGSGTAWKGMVGWRRKSIDGRSATSTTTEPDGTERIQLLTDMRLALETRAENGEDEDEDVFLTMDDA